MEREYDYTWYNNWMLDHESKRVKPRTATDPDSNVVYEGDKLLEVLKNSLKNKNNEEFIKAIDLLHSGVVWNDNLENQVIILKQIFRRYGFSKELSDQIEVVKSYFDKKDKVYDNFIKSYEKLYLEQKDETGLSFLCPALDKITGGIQPGTIFTIAGGPGTMKTTYAVNLAYNAIQNGKNVVYFSLEETPLKLTSKLLSRVSVDKGKNIKAQQIANNKLNQEEKEILFKDVLPFLKSQPGQLHIISEKDLISYETTEFERQLKMVDDSIKKEKGDESGVDVIVIDHVQLLKFGSDVTDEYRALNSYVSFFRRQALSFLGTGKEIIVILLSQVNREGIAYAKKHHGQYLMQHIAEGSEIERSSSYIITVYTDGMAQITKLLTLSALKLRGSQLPLDVINIFANGEYYQVGDAAVPTQANYFESDIYNTTYSTQEFDDNANLEDYLEGIL